MDTVMGSDAVRYTIKKPAAVKMSPWAKLIRRRMPYTIVYPTAISAYCPPTDMPASR